MYHSRVEFCNSRFSFTVFSPRHGECGCPDSRTGYGASIIAAYDDCEWSQFVDAPKE